MNRIFKFILFQLAFFYATVILASDSIKLKKPKIHFQLAENIGKAVANQPSFPSVKTSQLTEFSLLRQCNGAEQWHQYYNFPETGITFLYGTLGNQKVLGNVLASFVTLNFEKKSTKKLVFQKQLGFGFAYFNRPYDLLTNRENIVIGSHVTAVATLILGINYSLSDYISLHAGGSYFHFSNAHYQLPNLGLNSINARVGLTYYPHKKSKKFIPQSTFERDKKFHINLKMGLGINERGGTLSPTNGPKYPIYLASLLVTKRYSNTAILQIGVEANYNTGAHDFIIANEVFSEKVKLKSSTSIFFLGHELLWKRLSFVIQGGVFLYNPLYRELLNQQKTITSKQQLKALFTTKFGFQYYFKNTYEKFKNQVYIGSYVKANLGQADYWETSLGYCF